MSALFSDRNGWWIADPVCPIVYQDADPFAPDYNDGIWEATDNGANVVDLNDHDASDNARGRLGDDALYGNARGNRLQGDEGHDYVEGRLGRDVVTGNAGDDWLFGGDGTNITADGDDCLDGGAGRDWIDGETGDDLVTGGAGTDVLFGSAGADAMFGDDGDFGLGGDGDDTDGDAADWMSGGTGGDVMDGEGGDDCMFGGADDDTMYGRTGNDRMSGGTGRDSMAGGLGDDLVLGDAGDDEMFGDVRQGQGDDLDFGSDTWLGGLEAAPGGDDVMAGGSGDDIMDGGAGRDWMAGESGEDLMFGGRGSDMMDGGEDRDVLQGDAGVDRIRGGSDNDVIEGGAQGDWLYGDFARAAPFGWHMRFGAMADHANGLADGGTVFRDAPVGWIDLSCPEFALAKDRGEEGADNIRGGGGHDLIFGEGGNDRLFGDSGDDTMEGGDGRDSVVGNWGDDLLLGGRADDFLYGRQDDDRLLGEDGDDVLKGGDGQDTLLGGIGTDRLFGEAGCDLLEGEAGRDIMDGGAGDDLLLGGLGSDIMAGGAGADKLLGGAGRDDLAGDAGDDVLLGGAHGDWLRGGGDHDRLYGQAGVDFLRGGGGDDILHGGDANDRLYGDGGNDFLVAGAGNDLLVGGEGKDVFVFDVLWDGQSVTAGFGADILRDLDIDDDQDVVAFRVMAVGDAAGASGAEAFAALEAAATVTDDGAHTTIAVGGASVRLQNVTGGATPFTSLGQDAIPIGGIGLNAISTGDPGYYEVVNVAAVAPGLALATDEDTPVAVDLAAVPALAGLGHVEIVQSPGAGSARIEGGRLIFDPAGEFESLAAGEIGRLRFDLFAADAHTPGACPEGLATDLSVLVEIEGRNDAPTVDADAFSFDITEAADASSQSIGLATQVAFDDPDNGDLVDISYAVTDIAWSGGTVDPTLAAAIAAGLPAAVADAAPPGSFLWEYDATLDLDFLARGETLTWTVEITAADSLGATATDTIDFTVTGANDAPVITIEADDSTGETIDEPGAPVTLSGTLTVTDLDVNDTVTIIDPLIYFSAAGGGTGLQYYDGRAEDFFTTSPPVPVGPGATAGKITWTFDSVSETFDELGEGQFLVYEARIDVQDDDGTVSNSQIITVRIDGLNDAPTVSAEDPAPFDELEDASAQTLTASGSVSFGDIDGTGASSYEGVDITFAYNDDLWLNFGSISPALQAALEGGFSGTPVLDAQPGTTGWSYEATGLDLDSLGDGQEIRWSYTVTATDPHGATSTDTIEFRLDGTNDDPVAQDDNGGTTDEDTPVVTANVLSNDTDVDQFDFPSFLNFDPTSALGATVTYNNDGTFTYDPTTSATLKALPAGESIVDTFNYSVVDGYNGFDTGTVSVTVNGVNDAPTVFTGFGPTFTEFEELTASETVDFDDVDLGDLIDLTFVYNDDYADFSGSGNSSVETALVDGFSLPAVTDAPPGQATWSYDATGVDVSYLEDGETIDWSYTITATDSSGASDSIAVHFTIVGATEDPGLI